MLPHPAGRVPAQVTVAKGWVDLSLIPNLSGNIHKNYLGQSRLSIFSPGIRTEAKQLFRQEVHLVGGVGITNQIRGFVLEQSATGSTSTSESDLSPVVLGEICNSTGTTVPAPVDTGLLGCFGIDTLSKTVASLFLGDVTSSDVLHEKREQSPEPASLLTEEGGFSNATGVHGAERDTQLLVVTTVKLTDSHHVADLAVLVSLSTVPSLVVDHGNGLLHASLHALQLAEVSKWVNGPTTNSVVVTSDGTNNNNTLVRRLSNIVKKQANHEEVRQVVHLEAPLKTIFGEIWASLVRKVQGSVADKSIELATHGLDVLDELPHAAQRLQLQIHNLVAVLRQAHLLGNCTHFCRIADSHDDVPLARVAQGTCGLLAKTGRGTSNDNSLPLVEKPVQRSGTQGKGSP
mmetsp:Transcript_112267/g.194960  ORF Transcript_112267/g.194960 Transcript_112267/m.194960 type:complete len:403 (+) Transcript_112267:557-1765(+)